MKYLVFFFFIEIIKNNSLYSYIIGNSFMFFVCYNVYVHRHNVKNNCILYMHNVKKRLHTYSNNVYFCYEYVGEKK